MESFEYCEKNMLEKAREKGEEGIFEQLESLIVLARLEMEIG